MPTMDQLRARGDAELERVLLADRDIAKAIEGFDKQLAEQEGARRQLLSTSVRLTRTMAPELFEVIDTASERIGMDVDLEVYVTASPHFNAAAIRPEQGRTFVMFTSSLLEGFDDRELQFVIGHELAHHAYDHHKLPVGLLLSKKIGLPPSRVLELFAWQRYAEISCDRVGMYCCDGLDPAASALFKLSSGLTGDRVKLHVHEFLEQAADLQTESERLGRADEPARSDWFSSHPFSPLRLVAAKIFGSSQVFVGDGGISDDELESQVAELMSVMRPSYLSEKSDVAEAMRRLLFSGGVLIAGAHGDIAEAELKALEELLGPGSVPRELNLDAIRADLPRRIDRFKEVVPSLRRVQVLRDLCVIARADGHFSAEECAIVSDIARKVDVGDSVLDCATPLGDGTGIAHGERIESPLQASARP